MRIGGSAHGAPEDSGGQSGGEQDPQHRLVLDVVARTFTDGERTVYLSRQQVQIMDALASSAGIVTSADISAVLWPNGRCGASETDIIRQQIYQLRGRLRRGGISSAFLVSRVFIGYWLTEPVAVRRTAADVVVPGAMVPLLRAVLVQQRADPRLLALVGA